MMYNKIYGISKYPISKPSSIRSILPYIGQISTLRNVKATTITSESLVSLSLRHIGQIFIFHEIPQGTHIAYGSAYAVENLELKFSFQHCVS